MKRWVYLPVAILLVVRASIRTSFWWYRLPVDETVRRLRNTRVMIGLFRRPRDLERVAILLGRWLPPRGLRSCLKRSLLLLDLWSRCGLNPRLHLGVGGEDSSCGAREGHAWISADGFNSGFSERFRETYEV